MCHSFSQNTNTRAMSGKLKKRPSPCLLPNRVFGLDSCQVKFCPLWTRRDRTNFGYFLRFLQSPLASICRCRLGSLNRPCFIKLERNVDCSPVFQLTSAISIIGTKKLITKLLIEKSYIFQCFSINLRSVSPQTIPHLHCGKNNSAERKSNLTKNVTHPKVMTENEIGWFCHLVQRNSTVQKYLLAPLNLHQC